MVLIDLKGCSRFASFLPFCTYSTVTNNECHCSTVNLVATQRSKSLLSLFIFIVVFQLCLIFLLPFKNPRSYDYSTQRFRKTVFTQGFLLNFLPTNKNTQRQNFSSNYQLTTFSGSQCVFVTVGIIRPF